MRWVRPLLAWTVTACLVGAIAAMVVIPRLTGATPYVVLTGSMAPGMPPGTLVVVRKVDPRSIKVGNVITYQIASGKPDVVTHRVVAQGLDGRGNPLFQTKGDANESPDRAWVHPVQVKGERWYAVPELGRASALLSAHQHRLLSVGLGSLLLLYAARVFVTAALDRRRSTAGGLAHA